MICIKDNQFGQVQVLLISNVLKNVSILTFKIYSCLLRIVDSFGTEPAFNYEPYAKTHRMKTQWGMQNLNPQQFYTMFRKLYSKDRLIRALIIQTVHLIWTISLDEDILH